MELISLILPSLLWGAICMAVVEFVSGFGKEFIPNKYGYLQRLPEYLAYCICVGFALWILI